MEKIRLSIEGKDILIDYNKHFANLIRINESLNNGAYENYKKAKITYVDVPEIVGITGACENVDTLFKIGNRLNIPLFFTQTGQLSLEQSLQSSHAVYTVIHSGRDEEKEDKRHLRQFRLTEEEFDCTYAHMSRQDYNEDRMFETLLEHIQNSIQSMLQAVLRNNKEELSKIYKRDIDELAYVSKNDFLQISYEEAVRILNQNGYKNLKFGDDLKAEHEARIIELVNKGKYRLPVFITKYPKEIKFFNMKVYTKDPRVVLSADLILPYSGEATGSAVREHDFGRLKERLITSTMYKLHIERGGKYLDFKWYIDIIKKKMTNPHAGYGIGNERMLQYIFGESDIRNVSLFSLLDKQSGDWSVVRYGQAGIFSTDAKQILLTVGREIDKKVLLPTIKKLAKKKNIIIHATDGTHMFLKKHGVRTNIVYKISQIGKSPNISDLLRRRVFDMIINIPKRGTMAKDGEFTDSKLIKKGAIDMGIYLITDLEVALMVMKNLIG